MSFFRKAQKDLEKEKVLEKEKESNASQDAESQSVTSNNTEQGEGKITSLNLVHFSKKSQINLINPKINL